MRILSSQNPRKPQGIGMGFYFAGWCLAIASSSVLWFAHGMPIQAIAVLVVTNMAMAMAFLPWPRVLLVLISSAAIMLFSITVGPVPLVSQFLPGTAVLVVLRLIVLLLAILWIILRDRANKAEQSARAASRPVRPTRRWPIIGGPRP
jgi:glucan phosphoethanolaminetransferase (alkaline phosphatase superfamily)